MAGILMLNNQKQCTVIRKQKTEDMMKAKYTIFAAVAISITIASCSNNDEPTVENDGAAVVTANIGEVVSRAANTSWANGDAIGISTTSTGKTQYANMQYTTTGNGDFTHVGGKATGIFFQSMDAVTFSAYYPFTGTEGTAAGTISENTTDQTKQTSFDYLFADKGTASRTDPELEFAFKHKMTRLILNFQTDAQSGFSVSEVSSGSFSIGGIKLNGTFNTVTGTAAATGAVSASWTVNATPTMASNVRTYSMIFFPQTVTSLNVSATIGGENYGCEITPALKAGTSYSYTITIKKTGLTVGNCTISNWNTGTSGSVSAEMQ